MENSKGEFLGDANSLLLFSWKMEIFMIQLKKNIDFVNWKEKSNMTISLFSINIECKFFEIIA